MTDYPLSQIFKHKKKGCLEQASLLVNKNHYNESSIVLHNWAFSCLALLSASLARSARTGYFSFHLLKKRRLKFSQKPSQSSSLNFL